MVYFVVVEEAHGVYSDIHLQKKSFDGSQDVGNVRCMYRITFYLWTKASDDHVHYLHPVALR